MYHPVVDNACAMGYLHGAGYSAFRARFEAMIGKKRIFFAGGIVLAWASGASGFRNCEIQDSDAWAASTRYTVGELSLIHI